MIDVEDRPGVLADLTRKVARAGVDLDLVYVATRNRVVFGAPDLDGLKSALEVSGRGPLVAVDTYRWFPRRPSCVPLAARRGSWFAD